MLLGTYPIDLKAARLAAGPYSVSAVSGFGADYIYSFRFVHLLRETDVQTPLLRTLVGFGTNACIIACAMPSVAQTSKLIQNMDVNKDGKISRDEIPDGSATRRMFDNLIQKFNLDPKKTYTISEF